MITRQAVAERLEAYLTKKLSLEEMVDWAENQVMDADFESRDVFDVVARLGLADVRQFGLAWEDCQKMLTVLGYRAEVSIRSA